MKKLLRIIAIFTLSITLVGCGVEKISTYKMEQDGTTSLLTYTHKGDTVIKQTTENVMTYEAFGMSGEDDAKLLFESYSKQFADIEGIEHTIEYKEDSLVETITIDYETLDMDAAAEVSGILSEGSGSKISMKKSEEVLLAEGYEKV